MYLELAVLSEHLHYQQTVQNSWKQKFSSVESSSVKAASALKVLFRIHWNLVQNVMPKRP